MNIQQFNHLIHSTNKTISLDETKQLENLVTIFPYCQTGHLLLAKASKEQGNMTSEMKIKTASAYSVNRRHLKRFLLDNVTSFQKEKILLKEVSDEKVVEVEEIIIEDSIVKDVIEIVDVENSGEIDEDAFGSLSVGGLAESPIVVETKVEVVSVDNKLSQGIPQEELQKQELSIAEEIHKSLEELRKIKLEASAEEQRRVTVKTQEEIIENGVETEDLNTKDQLGETVSFSEDSAKEEIITVFDKPREEITIPVVVEDISKSAKKTKKAPIVDIKDKLKQLSKKVKEEGERKVQRAKKRQGEVFHYQPNEELFDSKLGSTGGEKENSEADLILKYLESLDKKKAIRSSRKSQHAILDKFIKNEPKISRVKLTKSKESDRLEDFSKNSSNLSVRFVNENMAKIHAKQGNTAKAIKIYKELMLKNTEKKSYFATQIEKLKKEQ